MSQPDENSVFFKKTQFALLKSIYFNFKAPTKQMLAIFQTRLRKSLLWQICPGTRESNFKDIFFESAKKQFFKFSKSVP